MSDNNKISDESLIIKKYKPLIDKLIPLQQQNRLLEGLNRFSDKLSSRIRTVIKNEVIRLTSLTDASADNSEFARFPVMKFKHFGIDMRLDKVGKAILDKETSRFLDRYTVGVYESVMNSDHYQSLIKHEQQEKIAKAFSVETQSFSDIDFANDLAIRPNFVVSCSAFEKGKKCPVASMGYTGMVVETKRAPVIEEGSDTLAFEIPPVSGFATSTVTIHFVYQDSSFNKDALVFESELKFADSVSPKIKQAWSNYIKGAVNQFPLQRDLEIERVLQDLERDRVLNYSHWVPVFLSTVDGQVKPEFSLNLNHGQQFNAELCLNHDLPDDVAFQRLVKELSEHQETFLLSGSIQNKETSTAVASTHRELGRHNLLKQFIQLASQNTDIKVIQCRLCPIAKEHKQLAFDIHDFLPNDYPELGQLSHVLFCKDVSNWVGNLEVEEPEPLRPFPRSIIRQSRDKTIIPIIEKEQDRRSEPRYTMDHDASIKTGLFSASKAQLNDLSVNGMKLTLAKIEKIEPGSAVKVSVDSLNISGLRYQVVSYIPATGCVHLRLPDESKQADGNLIQKLLINNADYFNARDLSRKQKLLFRYFWELCIRNLPADAVLTTNNRFSIDRLKTVYCRPNSYDLYPFEAIGTQAPLHGLFADKDSEKPRSSLLDQLLKTKDKNAHVVHAVKHNDKKIVYIELNEFLYGKTRKLLKSHVENKTAEACVTQIDAVTCDQPLTPLSRKRLALLSKIDINAYENILGLQNGYTHVIHLTNVSCFHNTLLQFGIKPIPLTPN